LIRSQETQSEIKLGLLWHSVNSSNYGVGALTMAHIRILDEVAQKLGAEISFEIAGWSDPITQYVHHPRLVFHPFNRSFLFGRNGLAAMARRCNAVLDIAGGDSFTDLYGTKRFLYQTISKSVVLASGTPLILAPQTIGPFSRPWARHVARMIMRRCQAVVVRDHLSAGFVREIDSRVPLFEATDVAFHLPFTTSAKQANSQPRVGINISGLLFGGGYRKKNDYGLAVDYPALIRELVVRLSREQGAQVHLFSHVIVPREFDAVEDDHRIAELVANEVSGLIVEPVFSAPDEFKSRVAAMDFFVGSRMHACIAAFSAGVPTMPLAYSRKFIGLFKTLDYPFVADCKSETDEKIVEKVIQAFKNRDILRQKVAASNSKAQQRIENYKKIVCNCLGNRVIT